MKKTFIIFFKDSQMMAREFVEESKECMAVHPSSIREWSKKLNVECPLKVPMELLNEETAQNNHSQSLKRLNERGGMGLAEMRYNIQRKGLEFNGELLSDLHFIINAINNFKTDRLEAARLAALPVVKESEEKVLRIIWFNNGKINYMNQQFSNWQPDQTKSYTIEAEMREESVEDPIWGTGGAYKTLEKVLVLVES